MSLKLAPINSKLSKIIFLLFLLLLIGFGAVPGYLKGQWRWQQPPQLTNLKQLKKLQTNGLALPGWQTLNHKVVQISGHKWLYQAIQGDRETPITLLLRPQKDRKDQPQVEWVDIKSFGRWQTQQYRRAEFTFTPASEPKKSVKVEAQFFQGWNPQQTFAVLQWYAWPQGGSPAPSRWFWADQLAQWQGRRVPWIAVSILIPIEPLGDIEKAWPLAQSLGQSVQAALIADPFQGS